MKLSKGNLTRAVEFIKENARALDKRRFEFHFNSGAKDKVLEELKKYQNADGGFGHAIEPDLRAKVSSPYATTVGIQHYIEVGESKDSSMIGSAVEYLVETYDAMERYWPDVFEDVNEEPHAPWWHVKGMKRPAGADWANPSAEIAGYLELYSEYVPTELLNQVRLECIKNLGSLEYIDSWLYNVMCWERVFSYFPDQLRALAEEKIRATFDYHHPMNYETLGEIRISWIAPSEESFIVRQYPQVVSSLYNIEIKKQAEDGGWWPTWQWGQYEEEWKIAKREWAGKITVDSLVAYREHGLLES